MIFINFRRLVTCYNCVQAYVKIEQPGFVKFR
jgi:hypothetical protein